MASKGPFQTKPFCKFFLFFYFLSLKLSDQAELREVFVPQLRASVHPARGEHWRLVVLSTAVVLLLMEQQSWKWNRTGKETNRQGSEASNSA